MRAQYLFTIGQQFQIGMLWQTIFMIVFPDNWHPEDKTTADLQVLGSKYQEILENLTEIIAYLQKQ